MSKKITKPNADTVIEPKTIERCNEEQRIKLQEIVKKLKSKLYKALGENRFQKPNLLEVEKIQTLLKAAIEELEMCTKCRKMQKKPKKNQYAKK